MERIREIQENREATLKYVVTSPPSAFGGSNSRSAIQRFKSGRLLLIYHQSLRVPPGENITGELNKRSNLTDWLSDDDVKNWYDRMLTSWDNDVSCPNFKQASDRRILYALRPRTLYARRDSTGLFY